MRRIASCCLVLLATTAACGACEDDCQEFVELSFVSSAATGVFASTAYTIVVDAEGKVATCEIAVDTVGAAPIVCQGDAEISVTTESDDPDASGTGGGTDEGPPRIIVRWRFTPATFDFVVRDADDTLVLSNTLSPAYAEQNVDACDGECRRFDREVTLPA